MNFLRSTVSNAYAVIQPKLMSTAAAVVEHYPTGMQLFHVTVGASILGCVGFVQAAQYTKGNVKGEMMF